MTDVDNFLKVEPERDRYGRYLIVPRDGGKARAYTRATTIAETLDERYNLEKWMQRMVAIGLAQRPDLYASVASLPPDDKTAINKLCDQAREAAAGSAGANLGTALHRFTERLNRGEDVNVPSPWDKDIEAYRKALTAYELIVDRNHLERIVVLEELGVAGMFDLILNGRIADLKTGATLDFSWCAIAVQLALYSHADSIYDPATKTHQPMPPVDQDTAIVIHLPAGKAICTLYEVDLNAGWEAAQMALWVRGWRKRKDLAKACPTQSATTKQPSSAAPSGSSENAPSSTASSSPSSISSETTSPRRGKTESRWASPKPSTSTPSPDEGGDADPAAVAALRARYEGLSAAKQEGVKSWVKAVKTHGVNLTMGTNPTVRRWEMLRALIIFGGITDGFDLLRPALGLALGEEVQPAVPLGAAVAALTIDEARKLCGIAEALSAGEYAVIFAEDGTVRIEAA